jgi:hypothetical protein
VESPSARPWLGVGAALSALPAAVGCFCAALLLAVVAHSDPGVVYEQHRWLGAVVAAGAVCAFVAMMGWATLRHGGVPAPVLLIALVVAGVPFALPGGLLLPATAAAVAACAGLAAIGLGRPPESLHGVRVLSVGLALAALVLAVGQAVVIGLHHQQRARHAAVQASRERPDKVTVQPHRRAASATHRAASAPALAPPRHRAAPAAPEPAAPHSPGATAPAVASPESFVRAYYAALDARRFAAAWALLTPGLQARFGGFEAWRRGYARTVTNSTGPLQVAAAGAAATVGLTLRAGDRAACGRTVVRRFAVSWRLARTDAGWRATAAEARQLSVPARAAAC